MIAQAQAKFIRVSPIKARQVIDLIRGKDVSSAQTILAHVNKGATKLINKVLNSAISNAKQKGLMEEQLYISKITSDQAAVWKRYRSAPFGRATSILKKTTHLKIELDLITK
ncbi:MAG TPA: 50S ribosomal protein L22 [Candidatus Omnitrophota bacterium]|nr:50S ribosomal protein L22 [Candidatus Omnitrophota bacterium]HPN89095.1 50S ribosomal protein L22 [Candidatus Omnitrophota bacterium]